MFWDSKLQILQMRILDVPKYHPNHPGLSLIEYNETCTERAYTKLSYDFLFLIFDKDKCNCHLVSVPIITNSGIIWCQNQGKLLLREIII